MHLLPVSIFSATSSARVSSIVSPVRFLRACSHTQALVYKSTHELAVANVVVNLASGVVAGSAATAITQPFDLMKTRMQLDPSTYRNTWHTARHIFAEAGWRGFFDGLSLRLARKPLSSAISWAIYEEFVRFATRQPLTGSQGI